MFHYVFHNMQAADTRGYGRDRASKIQVVSAWAMWARARRAERRSDAAADADAVDGADTDDDTGANTQGTTGDDPDRIVRDAQQQIYAGLEGTPGNQGTPGDQHTPDNCMGVSALACSTRASQQTRFGGETTVHSPAENDHGPEAVTGPSTSFMQVQDTQIHQQLASLYSECTWARCSGDCRCGVASDIPERTDPSDPAECCIVSDPFELCTWEWCGDGCTCHTLRIF
jgi:hypothetical protein